MAITLEEAKALSYGKQLHHSTLTKADGSCAIYRVSGVPKTWVTRPMEVRVPLKYGLNGNSYLTEKDLESFHLEMDCRYLQFRYLIPGDRFEFRNLKSGMVHGPWQKMGPRLYIHADEAHRGVPTRYKVGSINVWVYIVHDYPL